MLLKADEWDLVRFEKSRKKNKKIDAYLKNKKSGAVRIMSFGERGSETYWDRTGKGGDKVHGDPKRRQSYRARHKGEGAESRKYSPGFLSYHFLW